MSYLSLRFLLFTAVSLILYYALPKKCRPVVLLLSGLVFYVLCSKLLLIPVVCLTVVLYLGALWMHKKDAAFAEAKKELSKEERKAAKQKLKTQKKRMLALECVVAFGMLVGFKYLGFLAQIGNSLLSLFTDAALPVPAFLMPLGISYYTLSMVSYATDVYHGTIPAEKNFVKLMAFAVWFPQIVEGPIASYKKFVSQVNAPQSLSFDRFMRAGERILLGLVKKMILADRAGMAANVVFDDPGSYHFIVTAFAIAMYAVNIYFDFSGCIDIVSGVSELFGIELAQNFRRPFFSRSVQEFWRRWHMTLGEWIKNYIFYPLSLSKMNQKLTTSKSRVMQNDYFRTTVLMLVPLFFVWLFTGIWHGASWKYVLYGLYYYAILALGLLLEPLFQKLCTALHINREGGGYHFFQTVRTILLVLVGLTLFRADTTAIAAKMILSLFRVTGLSEAVSFYSTVELSAMDFVVIAVFLGAFVLLSCKEEHGKDLYDALEKHKVWQWIFCTAAIIALITLGVYGTAYTAQPFVYAQF